MAGFRCVVFRDGAEGKQAVSFSPTGMVDFENRSYWAGNTYINTAFNATTPNDNTLIQSENHCFVLEGCVFNSTSLVEEFKARNLHDALLHHTQKSDLPKNIKRLRGEFAGFHYDLSDNTLHGFIDHIGIHFLFYYLDDNVFICATHIPYITAALKELNISYKLDEIGAYYMLTFGFMLEDTTLIKELYRLKPGHCFEFDVKRWKLKVEPYYLFDNTEECKLTYPEMVEQANELFRNAVRLGIEKDRAAGKLSYFHLSDGLDCRMTSFVAEDLGCEKKLLVNYSHSTSTESTIPNQYAREIEGTYIQLPLDGGKYLTKHLDKWFDVMGGYNYYNHGASPLFDLFSVIDWSRYGINHNGHLGGNVFGQYLSGPSHVSFPSVPSGVSTLLMSRVAAESKKVASLYPNVELCKLNSRGVNYICAGPRYHSEVTCSSSPFMDPDFLDFVLSVPPKFRYNHKMRIDMICRYYPKMAQTMWGNAGMTIIQAKRLYDFTAGAFNFWAMGSKIKRKVNQIVLKRGCYNLAPTAYWYRTNPRLRDWIEGTFQKYCGSLSSWPDIKKDTHALYNSTVPLYNRTGAREQEFHNKLLAISLVYACHKYFG